MVLAPSVTSKPSSTTSAARRKVTSANNAVLKAEADVQDHKSKHSLATLNTNSLNISADNAIQDAVYKTQLFAPAASPVALKATMVGKTGYQILSNILSYSYDQIQERLRAFNYSIMELGRQASVSLADAKAKIRLAVAQKKKIPKELLNWQKAQVKLSEKKILLQTAIDNYNAAVGAEAQLPPVVDDGGTPIVVTPPTGGTPPPVTLTAAEIAADSVSTTDIQHYKNLSVMDRYTAFSQATATLTQRVSRGELPLSTYQLAVSILRRRILDTSSVY